MPRLRIRTGNYYHIYNRGVDRGDIFFTRENKLFFLRRLRQYCVPAAAEIIAYCLMPNHYHLLVQALTDNFGATVMQPFTISYTKAINQQLGRVGPVFQGPFQARHVRSSQDLLRLSRYIHLNPVTAGLAPEAGYWEFSSYLDYIGARDGTLPKPDAVLCHFSGPEAYAEYVRSNDDPRAGLVADDLLDDHQ